MLPRPALAPGIRVAARDGGCGGFQADETHRTDPFPRAGARGPRQPGTLTAWTPITSSRPGSRPADTRPRRPTAAR